MSHPHDPDQTPPNVPADDGPTDDPGRSPGADDPNATLPFTPEHLAQIEQDAPLDPDDPLVGTLLRNKWRVLGRIGSGSFGTVYKVRDVNGEWIEALKILSVDRLRGPDGENIRKRFLREAQIMKRLGSLSPHIVGLSTYEDDVDAGLIYFLMEHVEGRVLSEVLLHEGPLGVDRTIRIALQVCDALIAAHESEDPVVHRDLKLENIMLTTDREGRESIKVLDFGIAKIAEQEQDSRLTGAGSLGTPGYAAPEQLRAGRVDGRTDLFAFGVILYSLVTGRNPWLGHLAYEPTNKTYELMSASDRAEVIPLSETGVDVPPRLAAVIMKLLQRKPADRFQSARELRDALLSFAGAQPTTGGLHYHLPYSSQPSSHSSSEMPERRLAAVWFADLVGYSTLSSQDEDAALKLLDVFHKTARRVIEGGGGRVVQFIGDAAFAEFSSTQRAVGTAKDFIDSFAADTADLPFGTQLRIGVHVGDVLMAPDGDLYGDGVNIAARIQNEAEPGQILVSQDVWRQLRQRRDFGFQPIGERSLKGIGSPVSLFVVVAAGDVVTTADLEGMATTTGLPKYAGGADAGTGGGRARKAAGIVLLLGAVGAGGYYALGLSGGTLAEPEDGSLVSAPEAGGTPTGDVVAGAGEADSATDTESPEQAATTSDPPDASPEAAVRPSAPAEPVSDPEPTPAVNPYRERFDVLRPTVAAIREDARRDVHAGAQERLQDAEGEWAAALREYEAGRYEAATASLEGASDLFDQAERMSAWLSRVDSSRAVADAARSGAVELRLRDRGDELVADADAAVGEARYEDALQRLDEARVAFEEAAAAPAVPAVVVPEQVVADVLGRLERAIEAEDLPAVRAVWTSIDPDASNGFVQSFQRFDDVAVSFTVQSVTRSGDNVIANVVTEYRLGGYDSSTPQIFEMADREGTWVIVADRPGGIP